MAGNVQWREEIVQRRKVFDMLLLTDNQVSERGCKGSRRVSDARQEMCTRDFRFVRSTVAKPFPCA